MLLKSIARIVVKYGGNAAGFGVAGDAILDISDAIWNAWNKETPDQQEKLAEVQQLAELSADETRKLAQSLALEFAADQPETVREAVASYLTQVPPMVRRSMKRPGDPTGRTLPPGLLFGKPEDVLEFLPTKTTHFKPGDIPPGFGDWVLDELLGVGGFGEVWKAHHRYLDGYRPVALKFCTDAEAARALRHEATVLHEVTRRTQHPGIVALLDTALGSDPPGLKYEYVAGGDLTGLIKDRHRTPGGCSLLAMTELMVQLADIVGFAHRLSPPIVHRDLKTANILVSQLPAGAIQLKVADFGIGGIAADQAQKEAQSKPTNYFTVMAKGTCTPLYASPQQQKGEGADPRDDVFSIGVIWYQALTGDLSAGRPSGGLWRRKLAEKGLPAPMVDLLESCFEEDRAGRPRDAADLAERLKRLLPTPVTEGAKVQQANANTAKTKATAAEVLAAWKKGGPPPTLNKPQILVLKTLDTLRGEGGLTRRQIADRIEAEGVKLVEHRIANESYTYALLQGAGYIEEGGVGAKGEEKNVFRITPEGREAYAAALRANTEANPVAARTRKEGLRVPQVKILRFLAQANSKDTTFNRDEIALGITEKEGGKTAIGDALGRVDKEARERSDVANYPSLITLKLVEMVEMADPASGRTTIRYRITEAGREALQLAE